MLCIFPVQTYPKHSLFGDRFGDFNLYLSTVVLLALICHAKREFKLHFTQHKFKVLEAGSILDMKYDLTTAVVVCSNNS